jgi:hypothetical protein
MLRIGVALLGFRVSLGLIADLGLPVLALVLLTVALIIGSGLVLAPLFGRYKMVHAEGFPAMLFDLETDPDELFDLGTKSDYADQRDRLQSRLDAWYRQHHTRTTISDETIETRVGADMRRGILIGFWDQNDLDEATKLGLSGN